MKIRDIDIGNGIALAPMAGFSDYGMRRICHELGADYSVTEMVSAKATVYRDRKTEKLAHITPDEGPVGLQIFGSEPEVMAEAAAILAHPREGAPPALIDINMGCPVHKIFSNGEGSALMRSPELINRIVSAVRGAITIPLTVKLRLGIDAAHINVSECAAAAEDGGADAICIHGRTKTQLYSGKADMTEIKKVKTAARIPIFANGDITTAEDALRVMKDTGADGVMIGRGAVGNPFIFKEIKSALEGVEYIPPSLDDIREIAIKQLEYSIAEKGEEVAVREARKQIAGYFHGYRGAAELRAAINRAETLDAVKTAIFAI